jgi:hypothetical protein
MARFGGVDRVFMLRGTSLFFVKYTILVSLIEIMV